MASLWDVPVEAIYKDGYTYSTLYDMHADRPNAASDQEVIFTAPHGHTGLWLAHSLDQKTPSTYSAMDMAGKAEGLASMQEGTTKG
ncbi:hypothetical protein [Arthrobacter sp. MDT1-65]